MGICRLVLIGSLLAFGAGLAYAQRAKLPEALQPAASDLAKARDEGLVEALQALLREDNAHRALFSAEIAEPKTRKTALATIEAVDAELAASIERELPEGQPDEATLARVLAPWFETHVEAPLVELIEREVDGLRRSHARRAKSLLSAVPAVSSSALKRRGKDIADWSAARDEALAIILDEKLYPDGNYDERTQKPLDKKIRVVWLAHKKLTKTIDADLAKLFKDEPEKWLERLQQTDASNAALIAVAPLLDGRVEVEAPDTDQGDAERMRRARGVVRVHLGETAKGRALLEGKDTYDDRLFVHTLERSIERHNAKTLAAREGPQLTVERDIARRIDEYRMAMGLLPLEYDERLQQCAFGHSEEMRGRRYFAHDSPNPERRTFEDRARLAGYPNPHVGEMIYKGTLKSEGKDVFMTWFYSALHHRLMLHDGWMQVGIARSEEYFTLNFGRLNAVER